MGDYELGVIGAGNMAEAVIGGAVAGGILSADGIVASDPLAERRDKLTGQLAIACVEDNLVPAACRRVLLAVKPQMMGGVLDEISAAVGADATVISIAAGISTGFLDERLGGAGHIVRVMPNTPMLVGAGVAALAGGPRATQDDLAWVRELLAASGQVITVGEEMMDAVTAVSGSGPAYFFYLIEAMIAAGVAEGLDERTAQMLAVATCGGVAKLLGDSTVSPLQLRQAVTSPGGTTQRAIESMEADGVGKSLVKAIRAAAARSRELG